MEASPAIDASEHLGLVYSVVKKARTYLTDRGIDFDEAISAGSLALVRAAIAFDPAKGNQFSTFAVTYIRNSLRELARQLTFQRNGAHRRIFYLSEFRKYGGRDGDQAGFARIVDRGNDLNDERISDIRADNIAMVRRAMLHALTPRERGILVRKMAGDTHGTISADMGVSKQRVSQILEIAEGKLRRWLTDFMADPNSLL